MSESRDAFELAYARVLELAGDDLGSRTQDRVRRGTILTAVAAAVRAALEELAGIRDVLAGDDVTGVVGLVLEKEMLLARVEATVGALTEKSSQEEWRAVQELITDIETHRGRR